MPYQLPDGRLISPEMSFELNEIQYPPNYLKYLTESERNQMGITWVDPEPETPPPPYVPTTVTPYQARVALTNAGLRDQVETVVAQADQGTRDAWEYGIAVDRHSPMIVALAGTIGLTEEQVNELFIQASQVV